MKDAMENIFLLDSLFYGIYFASLVQTYFMLAFGELIRDLWSQTQCPFFSPYLLWNLFPYINVI